MPFSSKKILLTGARGRLAGCIAPHLKEAGHHTTGFSHQGTPSLQTLLQSQILEDADALLHLAWSTLPATSEKNIGIEWETDLPLLIKLLRRIVESPARDRLHFIFFSSGGAVYGPTPDHAAKETDICHPIGWYAQAKVAAEEIIQIFGERHGLTYTILRVSNPYGFPLPPERAQGIIPRAIDCAWRGLPLTLWGNGSARKDFLYYTDFNRAIQVVIDRRLTGIYNLAHGESSSVLEIIRHIEKITGNQIPLQISPARPWDVQSSLLDNSKLRDNINWAPATSLYEGLRLTAMALKPND